MNRLLKNGAAVLLTLAMLICQSTVFAADGTEAETPAVSSVSEAIEGYLKGFGIFYEGEAIDDTVVTRAEAADKFVRAAGFDYGMIGGETASFSDVAVGTSAWKASEAALILGVATMNDERMFYPNRTLTRIEALTMAVRTMKAEAVASLRGGYPDGYLSIANESYLLNGISGDSAITRKDLAYIIYNMHHAQKYDITYEGDRISYTKNPETTVAEDLLGVKKYKAEFVSTDLSLRMLELKFTSGDKKGTTEKYNVSDKIDLSQVGGSGYVYINEDDDEVVYLETKKGSNVIYDYIETVNNSYDNEKISVDEIKKLSFVNDEKIYDTDEDLVVYFNEKKVNDEVNSYKGCFAKAVVRDGKIIRIDMYELKHGGQVLYSVHDTFRFKRAEEEREWTDIDDIKSLELYIDGTPTDTMLDIKGDMIFDFWRDEENDKLMIIASSRVANGKVTGRKGEDKITIDGVTYDVSDDVATFNIQADEYRPGLDYDYISGQNVAAYFADDRTIRYIKIDAVNVRQNVVRGVITNAYEEKGTGDKYIKVFHIDDNLGEVEYKVADKLKSGSLSFTYAKDVQKNYEGAGFLEFTLNSKNEIRNIDNVKYFGYEQLMTEHNVPPKGVVCGQYCNEAKWFAILNIDGEFTVRRLTYSTMHYMHKDGGGLRIISDFNSRYNSIPQYFMLLGWENAATAYTDTSFIRDIRYVDDDTSKLVMVNNVTFDVSNDYIRDKDLQVNDLVEYRATKTSKEPVFIDRNQHMPDDSSQWTYDAWRPNAGEGFYKADDVSYYNDAAIQFIVNGEYTDAYKFNDNGINEGNMTKVYRHDRNSFTLALMNFGYEVNYAREYRGAYTMNLRKGDNIWFHLNSDRVCTYIIYEPNGNNYD